ncbi:hypothetical protein [Poritiphilus flavus]|uniref:O-antigen ligase like membrane protein n=1 Tax=Poritiphilus flavus TaxID=2697053 RepID=A0A6L9ECA5_9FLAO|nr:hypothetical protein [Poritiphilus flavus]NAS12370.1 hypothetical protein [Poritiphilus flavus]
MQSQELEINLEKTKQIDKLISFLLFFGLFLNLFFIYFAQERLYMFKTTGFNFLGPEKYIRIVSVISIILTALISVFFARAKYHLSIYFAYSILVLSILLNYLLSGADLFNTTEVMDNRGIGTWVCFGLIFVSYHHNRFEFFKKFLYLSVIVISLLCLYNFFDFGIGLYRGQALSKYRVYATNLVWIVPYVFLILKNNKKLKWLRLFALGFGILLALITQTRSFLIIYLITILFDFYHTKRKGSYLILFLLGFVGLIFLIINTEIFSTSWELLINRGTEDTRSNQLETFLEQLNGFELVTGSGFFATYQFGSQQWSAIDNQWLFLLWWGGLLPVLSYFYLSVVVPIKMIRRGNLSYETKVECYIIILWILGLTGLAIFTTMSVDFFFFVISIILGRLLYKYSSGMR